MVLNTFNALTDGGGGGRWYEYFGRLGLDDFYNEVGHTIFLTDANKLKTNEVSEYVSSVNKELTPKFENIISKLESSRDNASRAMTVNNDNGLIPNIESIISSIKSFQESIKQFGGSVNSLAEQCLSEDNTRLETLEGYRNTYTSTTMNTLKTNAESQMRTAARERYYARLNELELADAEQGTDSSGTYLRQYQSRAMADNLSYSELISLCRELGVEERLIAPDTIPDINTVEKKFECYKQHWSTDNGSNTDYAISSHPYENLSFSFEPGYSFDGLSYEDTENEELNIRTYSNGVRVERNKTTGVISYYNADNKLVEKYNSNGNHWKYYWNEEGQHIGGMIEKVDGSVEYYRVDKQSRQMQNVLDWTTILPLTRVDSEEEFNTAVLSKAKNISYPSEQSGFEVYSIKEEPNQVSLEMRTLPDKTSKGHEITAVTAPNGREFRLDFDDASVVQYSKGHVGGIGTEIKETVNNAKNLYYASSKSEYINSVDALLANKTPGDSILIELQPGDDKKFAFDPGFHYANYYSAFPSDGSNCILITYKGVDDKGNDIIYINGNSKIGFDFSLEDLKDDYVLEDTDFAVMQ